jgi:hypothetical protein
VYVDRDSLVTRKEEMSGPQNTRTVKKEIKGDGEKLGVTRITQWV